MLEDRVTASERREAQQTDKRRGIVLGAAVGDALGVPYEFLKRGSFECTGMSEGGVHGKPAGTFSDDTSLLLATCASLKERGEVDVADMRGASATGSMKAHTRLMEAPSTLETPRRPPSNVAAAATGSAPTATGPSCASPRSSSCMHRMARYVPYRR